MPIALTEWILLLPFINSELLDLVAAESLLSLLLFAFNPRTLPPISCRER
jgi:hypothetical protein